MTKDEVELATAVTNAANWLRAELLVLDVGIAAHRYPDLLRTALASVFDMRAIEDEAKRILAVAASARDEVRQMKELLRSVHDELDGIEKKMDGITYQLEKESK